MMPLNQTPILRVPKSNKIKAITGLIVLTIVIATTILGIIIYKNDKIKNSQPISEVDGDSNIGIAKAALPNADNQPVLEAGKSSNIGIAKAALPNKEKTSSGSLDYESTFKKLESQGQLSYVMINQLVPTSCEKKSNINACGRSGCYWCTTGSGSCVDSQKKCSTPFFEISSRNESLDIKEPGTYLLTEDLSISGEGIGIRQNNVIVDCQGHKMVEIKPSYNGLGFYIGNYVGHPARENVVVRNCRISNFYQGISIYNSKNVDIINNEIAKSNYGITVGDWSRPTELVSNAVIKNNIIDSRGYINEFGQTDHSNNIVLNGVKDITLVNNTACTSHQKDFCSPYHGLYDIYCGINNGSIFSEQKDNIAETSDCGIELSSCDNFSCLLKYYFTWHNNDGFISQKNDYSISNDKCAGYRCLRNRDQIEPSCYNTSNTCQKNCDGSCLNVAEKKKFCDKVRINKTN